MSTEQATHTPIFEAVSHPALIESIETWLTAHTTDEIIRELHVLLRSEELVAQHLAATAIYTYDDIHQTTTPDDAHPASHFQLLDKPAWQKCIDPALPTIGLLASERHSGNGLLAKTAQHLRQRGNPIANLVMIPDAAYGRQWHDGQAYYIQQGVIVDPEGTVYFGHFPEPLRLDCHTTLSHMRPYGDPPLPSYINDPADELLLENKTAIEQKLRHAGIPTIPTLYANAMPQDPELHNVIRDYMTNGQAIVVKPNDGNLGTAVLMADPRLHDAEEIVSKLQSHPNSNQKFLVQPWIQCPTLHFRETGVQADWNIRALLYNGAPIGMYARVGRFGEPINISRSAGAYSLDEVFAMYQWPEKRRAAVTANIWNLCRRIGDTFPGSGILSADIVLQQSLQSTVMELNGEYSGGLPNILRTTPEHRYDESLIVAVQSLDKLARGLRRRNESSPIAQPPRHDPASLMDCIWQYRTLNKDAKHPQITYFAAAALNHIYSDLTDAEKVLARPLLAAHGLIEDNLTLPSNQRIDDSIARYFTVAKQQLAISTNDAFELVETYAATDPTSLRRQHRATNLAAALLGEIYGQEFQLLQIPEQITSHGALAVGRLIFVRMAAHLGIKDHTITTNTFQALEDTFASYIAEPLPLRNLPPVDEVVGDAQEGDYLAILFDYINAYHSAVRGETEELEEQLEAIYSSQPLLASKLRNHLIRDYGVQGLPPDSRAIIDTMIAQHTFVRRGIRRFGILQPIAAPLTRPLGKFAKQLIQFVSELEAVCNSDMLRATQHAADTPCSEE